MAAGKLTFLYLGILLGKRKLWGYFEALKVKIWNLPVPSGHGSGKGPKTKPTGKPPKGETGHKGYRHTKMAARDKNLNNQLG